MQLVAADDDERPAAQLMHMEAPLLPWNVLAAQLVQSLAPDDE